MKENILPVKQLLLMLLLVTGINTFAQEDTPDYLRNPTLPPFTLLRSDSTKITRDDLRKNTDVLIMLFSPDCGHCRFQTDSLIANIDKLKDIDIVMTTFEPLKAIAVFSDQFNLERYPNIKVGRDIRYFFTPYYQARSVPFLALYNEKGNLVTTFNERVPVEKLIEAYKTTSQ